MAAMITNHFKLRRDVLTYNLSGMGCSSSLICIDLVKHLLKVRCLPYSLLSLVVQRVASACVVQGCAIHLELFFSRQGVVIADAGQIGSLSNWPNG